MARNSCAKWTEGLGGRAEAVEAVRVGEGKDVVDDVGEGVVVDGAHSGKDGLTVATSQLGLMLGAHT